MTTRPEPWVIDALCAQVGGDSWFPETGQPARQAQAICRRCPVRVECLEYAIRANERTGVYGGLTARARRLLKARPAA